MKNLNYLLTVLLLSLTFSSSWATKVLVAGASSDTEINGVADDIRATGLFESVDILSTTSGTPTLSDLQAYDVVLYWTYWGPANSTSLGNVFVEYINQGGGLLTFALEGTNNAPLGGNFNDDYKIVVQSNYIWTAITSFTSNITNHPTMEGVESIYGNTTYSNACYHASNPILQDGSYTIATLNDETLLLALRENIGDASARGAYINFMPIPSDVLSDYTISADCDATRLITNTIEWIAGGSIDGDKKNNIGEPDTIKYTALESETFVKWSKKQNDGPWVVYNTTDTFLIENYDTISEWHYMVEYIDDGITDTTSIFTVQSKYAQTLSFDALAEMAMTDDDQAISASANSDSAITFSSSNESIATIVDDKIHPVGVGTCTITANAEENDWYWASEQKTQEVIIKSQAQTITLTLQDTAYVGDADIAPGATATSNLTVSYSSSDSSIATIVDNKIQLVSEGTCLIYANQAGDVTYAAAQTAQDITVLTHTPIITNIFPTENDTLIIDSIYTTKAIIKTDDPAGIDTAIAFWGASPEALTLQTGLIHEEDSFYTELSMSVAGTYYRQIVAYGVNGKNDSTEVVAVTFMSSSYYQGAGSEEDPFLISSKADLIHLSLDIANWDKHFLQTADITFDPSGIEDWNGDGLILNDSDTLGFNPIGYNSGHMFSGSYNGDNYSISNIMINANFTTKPYDEPQDEIDIPSFGLFGKCIEATLSNIMVENINIKTSQYPFAAIGGLVGTAFATPINQCTSSGVASNKESAVFLQGGLVGLAFEAEAITNSSSSVTIIAEDIMSAYYAGGFVGLFIGDVILNCFSTGAIINNNPSIIEGELFIGGFGGMVGGAIAFCYSTGYIQTDLVDVNGSNAFVGDNEASDFYSCYYDYTTQMTGQNSIASEINPLAYINFKDGTNFEEWSISTNGDSAWVANPIGRPYLVWQDAKVSNDTIAGNFEDGFSLSGSIATDGTVTEKGVITINTTTLEIDTFISTVASTDSIAIDFPAYNFGDEYIAQAYAVVDGATYYGDAVFMVRNTCLGATTTTALEATDITPTGFTAHWEVQDDASKYLVTVYDMYGDTKTIALDNTEVTDTFIVVSNLVSGRTYYYTVKTVGAHDCVSDDSNTIDLTTAVVTELQEQAVLASVRTRINTIEIITQANTNVNIYQISGVRIVSKSIQSATTFEVESGIYIVELDNMVHKVIVP